MTWGNTLYLSELQLLIRKRGLLIRGVVRLSLDAYEGPRTVSTPKLSDRVCKICEEFSHIHGLTPSASERPAHGLPSISIRWMNKLNSLRTQTDEVTSGGSLSRVGFGIWRIAHGASQQTQGEGPPPSLPSLPNEGHNNDSMMKLGSSPT